MTASPPVYNPPAGFTTGKITSLNQTNVTSAVNDLKVSIDRDLIDSYKAAYTVSKDDLLKYSNADFNDLLLSQFIKG